LNRQLRVFHQAVPSRGGDSFPASAPAQQSGSSVCPEFPAVPASDSDAPASFKLKLKPNEEFVIYIQPTEAAILRVDEQEGGTKQ
jgi:hypothetical protein